MFGRTVSSSLTTLLPPLSLSLLVTVFVLLGQQPAKAQIAERLIPIRGSANAFALQTALNDAGCYPAGTNTFARTDGNFGTSGSRSRQAVSNYLSTRGLPVSSYTGSAAFTNDVRTSGVKCPQGSRGVCRKDAIGSAYLENLKGVDDARNLSAALQTVIRNFDAGATAEQSAVFPEGAGDPVVLTEQNSSRMKEYGVPGVTPASTFEALKSAAYNFDNLVLSYALQSPACSKCAIINDWLYLRNIASANAGFLIGEDPTDLIFKRFSVNKVPEDLLNDVRANIRVYRSITAKLNRILTQGSDPLQIQTLIKQRSAEMYGIISHFEANAARSTAPRMPSVSAKAKCIGFDGSAIYQ